MNMIMEVRRAALPDFDAIVSIHREAFPRQIDSENWVRASLVAAPRIIAYVLSHEREIAGYLFWVQKSGIRPAAVVELDQIAVSSKFRGRGLGARLIRESFTLLRAELAANGQEVKSILVSTRADNEAQRLYSKVLGAKVVASIDDLYSATEIFMIADGRAAALM